MAYSKYRAIPTVVDGIRFSSKKEAARYSTLKLLQMGGKISDLKLQPRFRLEVNGVKIADYVGDFSYIDQGEPVIEDAKGVKTPVYKIKRLLMWAIHGIEIRET